MESRTPEPPGPNDKTVFISYRREETIDVVGRIYSWLIARLPSNLVFLDTKAIPAGYTYSQVINNALVNARVVLVVIGKQWLTIADESGDPRIRSTYDLHRLEIETALSNHKPIIPLLVQGMAMPRKDDLPESIASISDIQAIEIRPDPDFDNDMRKLRTALLTISPLPFSSPVYPQSDDTANWVQKYFRRDKH